MTVTATVIGMTVIVNEMVIERGIVIANASDLVMTVSASATGTTDTETGMDEMIDIASENGSRTAATATAMRTGVMSVMIRMPDADDVKTMTTALVFLPNQCPVPHRLNEDGMTKSQLEQRLCVADTHRHLLRRSRSRDGVVAAELAVVVVGDLIGVDKVLQRRGWDGCHPVLGEVGVEEGSEEDISP